MDSAVAGFRAGGEAIKDGGSAIGIRGKDGIDQKAGRADWHGVEDREGTGRPRLGEIAKQVFFRCGEIGLSTEGMEQFHMKTCRTFSVFARSAGKHGHKTGRMEDAGEFSNGVAEPSRVAERS